MPHTKWALLDSLKEEMTTSAELRPEVIAAISERLEAAILSGATEGVRTLSDELLAFFLFLLRKSPPSVVAAVKGGSDAEVDTGTAYLLGQVGFAQLLAAQVAENSESRLPFEPSFLRRHQKLLVALLRCDMTSGDLAKAAELQPETTSRKLAELRGLGITDFRKEGANKVNFLTPAGRAAVVAAKLNLVSGVLTLFPPRSRPLSPKIQAKYEELPQHLQQPHTFAEAGSLASNAA